MQNKIRNIFFVIPTLTSGGAEKVVTTILKHLDRSKFKLSLAVVDMSNEVYLDKIPTDVTIYDLKCSRVRYGIFKILVLIWKLKPNTIFTTLGHLNIALAACRIFMPPNVRIVARETTIPSQALQVGLFGFALKFLYKTFYSRVDLLICQSKAMQVDLVLNFKFPLSKTIVIHNPLEIQEIHKLMGDKKKPLEKNPNSISFVAAGRLIPVKGFDLLIEAIIQLSNKNIHLTILGEGPDLERLKRLSQVNGLSGQITFAGFQKNPFSWFRNADAFIMSSRYEGFPNVVLEALACGIPVISTPAPGGIEEILHSMDGCIVASEVSAKSLKDAIALWIDGPRILPGINAVNPYSLTPIIKKFENALLSFDMGELEIK